ncbi:MAG: FtsH protease activity modulator HflK [Gemmatimonadetes bacterium]|nr:FtsH protease activity modulator HflK [Gemmatimonadota bacterium]MYF17565.1 FtsH protease activity modulator HflK [Gemmatimonadota bacterium]
MQEYQFPNRPNFDLQFNPKFIYYGLIVLALLWLASGIYTVRQDEQAVVFRFGQAVSLEDPGIHYHWPTPIERIEKERVSEVKRLEVGFRTISVTPTPRYQKVSAESAMLTGDENIVDVELIVQYRIRDLENYLFQVNDQRKAIKDVTEAALRQVVGQRTIDEALTEGKLEIQEEILKQVQEVLDLYQIGVRVDQAKLQTVSVPQEVDHAFKDVANAREDKERLRNEAEAYRNDIIPKTRGEAERMIREAEAYKVERVKRSQGDADRFVEVLKEYRNAKDVTETRMYLETMEKILPSIQKYVVESDGKGGILNVLNLQKPLGGGN